MKGRVDAYDPVNGFGFVKDSTGRMYLAHNSEVRLEIPVSVIADLGVSPPVFLLPGWDVEFEPVKQPDGRWKAVNIVPLDPDGFSINPVRQRPAIGPDGVVAIEVTGDGTIAILGRKMNPVIGSDHFRIYYLGNGVVTSFNVKLPAPTAAQVFVLLRPSKEKKAPRNHLPDGLYQNVKRGSFVMAVRRDGHVIVLKVGTHDYNGAGWLILSVRFEHEFTRLYEYDETEIRAQIPDIGKADANWDFAKGATLGFKLMKEAATK